ncbi:MAG: DUF1553 domain-containing protein [Planctomycetaceae bacterium]|nr:DUF1553 domain-containing protein [Planctomycetaceae bacterium]
MRDGRLIWHSAAESKRGLNREKPRCLRWLYAGVALVCCCSILQSGSRAAPPARDASDLPNAAQEAPPTFDRDIRPILAAKCLKCHGETGRKGDLDLRTAAGIAKGGESGSIVEPGNPDESLLYEKVHDGSMPPDKKDRLSETDVAMIRRWIEAGAATDGESADSPAPTVGEHDVLPILLRRCAVCHGASQREAGLDLRSRAGLLRGGKSGPAIVPGQPEESLLIQRIRSAEMPPIKELIEVSIKPIEPAEIETIAAWIARGAPEANEEPDVATTIPDPAVTDQERDFWSFRPPVAAATLVVRQTNRVRNPVDAFILAKLEERGLTLAPEADRSTLHRRLCFDLTGLPPEPAQIEAFLADTKPDAYERLVERLLDSPRYGERWGRHWLDLAGYADSEGKREQDLPRPSAYRYRDYVIRAFNDDKPYDRFLLEQIAGDELADYEHAPEITPELYDNLVATGFLRMAPDPTWYNLTNFVPDRVDVIADEIDVLGSSVMGLTMKCARCHSHKFDPLPHRDYYRLVAVFKGAFDEYDWMKSTWNNGLSHGPRSDRDLPYVTTAERRQWESHNAALQKAIEALQVPLDELAATLTKQYQAQRIEKLPAELREDVRAMLAEPADKRTPVQQYLAEKFEKSLTIDRAELANLDADFKKRGDEASQAIASMQGKKLPEPRIRALWDRGDPSPTYIYRRGDYLTPARLVGPGVPSVLTDGKTPLDVRPPWPGAKSTGRRLAFARWLTQPDQPLTSRVMVNRIWKHHFGTGLVKTLDNFGKTGTPPTHPELLDYLATQFTARGWSIKAMHRLLVTSATYRQSSVVTLEASRIDPDNAFVSRMPLQRLSAEQLYDALLLVSGRLDETRFGPADAVDVRADGLATPRGTERGWRRGIYISQQRKVVVTHFENFDFPAMNPNCGERRDSTVTLQALHLWNNGVVQQLADSFAGRIEREAAASTSRQIERIYLTAFGRTPNDDEVQVAEDALVRLTGKWLASAPGAAPPDRAAAAHQALVTLCHAILNSAEFLYVD